MAWSESIRPEEVTYLVDYLESRAWIGRPDSNLGFYRITVDGYARLAEVEEAATDSSKAFVAMWFDESMDEVWENAIKPGIEDAGYEAIRIDHKEHLNKIDDEIIAELRRARFIVADFTHGDDGDSIGKVHFDTRQYPHILWDMDELDAFRRALTTRISATIGDGPRAA